MHSSEACVVQQFTMPFHPMCTLITALRGRASARQCSKNVVLETSVVSCSRSCLCLPANYRVLPLHTVLQTVVIVKLEPRGFVTLASQEERKPVQHSTNQSLMILTRSCSNAHSISLERYVVFIIHTNLHCAWCTPLSPRDTGSQVAVWQESTDICRRAPGPGCPCVPSPLEHA